MYQLPAKMAAVTICNETSVSDLKTRLRRIYRVIESYRWIVEAYVSVICFVHIFLFLFCLSLFLPVELSLDLKSVSVSLLSVRSFHVSGCIRRIRCSALFIR